MVSKTKIFTSLSVSTLVTVFRYVFYRDLGDLLYLSPLLIIYCLGDLRNSTDMIIHHLATIALNITFFYVIHNRQYLTPADQESVGQIVCSFFEVEMSTILLSMLHLGYRHSLVKLAFFCSFTYYRIYHVTWRLWNHYRVEQIRAICQNSSNCYLSWYLGCTTLVAINYYWFVLIVGKIRSRTRHGGPKVSTQ